MTTQNCACSEEEQQVFDYLVYGENAREVGKGLTVLGYIRLLKDGFPDDPEIIKKYFVGQWDNEEEAVKACAEKLNMDEDLFKEIWPEIKEGRRMTVLHLEDGCVVIYEQ